MAIGYTGFDLMRGDWLYMEERFCGTGYFPGEDVTRFMASSYSSVVRRQRQRSDLPALHSWYSVNTVCNEKK